MQKSLCLAKLIAISLMLCSICLIPVKLSVVVCLVSLLILLFKDREMLVKCLKTATVFTVTYVCMALVVYLAVGMDISLSLTMTIPVAVRLFTICVASFLVPYVVGVFEITKVLGFSILGLLLSTTISILRSLPKISEIRRVIELNYGYSKPFSEIKVLALIIVEKSIEYTEQLCLKLPSVCVGDLTHRIIQPHTRLSAVHHHSRNGFSS